MEETIRVLILDDDPNLRRTLGDILTFKGFSPVLLGLGKEAIERASREEIAVALIDLRLDDMPGLDVLRKLRETSPSTECILLTGNASQASAIEAVNLGAYSYIQKPFDIDQLILAIRRAVEKRNAAKALAESQELYRTFINATSDMAFLKDENFHYIIVNEANAEFFGKNVEEVIGKSDSDLMPNDAAQACRQSDEQALLETRSVIAVEEIEGRFYETRKFPVPLQEGRMGVGGYIRDITERKQAEGALRDSEERYRMLADNMSDTIWLMDLGLKLIYISPSVIKTRGYTLDELNAIPLDQQMTPDSFQAAIKLFAEALSPESLARTDKPISRTLELEFYRKDGTRIWSENTFTLIRHADGTPQAILGSGRDITERKHAQMALENSEKRFRALIENSTDVIALLDPRGRILYNSPAYRDVLGYEPRERVGKSAFELIHPEDQPFISQVFNTIIQQPGENHDLVFRVRHKDGSWRWLDATASNMLGEPAIQGIVVNFRDITIRRQAEQELRQSEEKFRSVIQQSVDGIVLSDENGIIIEWNQGEEEITGVKGKDALGKYIWDVQFGLAGPENKTPENYERLKSATLQALGSGESPFFGVASENPLMNPQKGRRFIQTLVFPIRTEKGFMICSIARDTTEKRQDEETLRRQLAELEVLYANGLTISRLLEPRQIARQMIEILSMKLAWHHAAIRLYHPETDSVEALAVSHPSLSAEELQQQIEHLNQVITRPGKGMSGWVIKYGKPIRSGNVNADKRYLATYPGIQSGIYVPIQIGDRTIGSIAVESEKADAFAEQDQRILTTLANQAAIAFENARLYQEAVRDAEQRAILHRAGQDVTAAGLDLETVYSTIEKAAAGLTPFDALIISRYDAEKQESEVVYAVDGKEHYSGYRVPIGQGITGRVIKERKSLVIRDYRKTKKTMSTAFGKGDSRSILAVPMFAGTVIVGVISIQSYNPNIYRESDTPLMEILAAYAGPAIENARLFEKERKQRQLAEALRDALGAGASLSTSLTFETVTDRLLEALERVIAYDGANISLVDHGLARVARTRGYNNYGARAARDITAVALEIQTTKTLSWMSQNQQPLVIPDVNEYPGWVITEETKFIRSWAGAPIIINGETIAFFAVDKGEANFYTAEHFEILKAFTGQVTLALQNARLFEQTRRRAEELSALADVSSALRTAQSRTDMMPAILNQITSLLDTTTACLIAYNPANGESIVETGRGKWAKANENHLDGDDGLISWMAQTRLSYRSDDTSQDKKWLFSEDAPQVEAIAGVPLLVQGQFIGSIWVGRVQRKGRAKPVPFTSEDVRLLSSIADIAASALHRATLHEQAVWHAEQLITVNEIGHVLGETLEPNQIYTRLTGAIYNLIPDIAGLFISLFDKRAKKIMCVCGHIDGAFVDSSELPALPFDPSGGGRQSHVILTGEPLIANDLARQPVKGSVKKFVGDPSKLAQSGLYVPMIVKGEPIGLIQLQSYTPNRFNQEDTNLLFLVANTAAIAIENARLFTETQKRLRNLSALHAIDTAISASVDLRVTLGILLEHTDSELKVDASAILLLNPVTHMLEYTVSHGFYTHLIEGTRVSIGSGLAGQAAIQRRVQSIPDLRTVPLREQQNNIYGNEGFITHHAIPLIAKGQVQGVLEVFHRTLFQPDEDWFTFFETLSGQAAIAIDNSRLFEDLQRSNLELILAYDATIQGWSQALELRDKETEGHAQRVTDRTMQLAQMMGIPESEMEHVRRGTLLHDIGKMGIPDAILLKPDKLTPEEWEIMKRHPVYAYEMLASIIYLRPALAIPHYHHEKWDGTGYPDGLKGEQIPLPARIFAIVDVYDALTNERPYRPAWSKEKTLDYIRGESGKQFDPKVVDAFLRLISEEK